MDPHASSASVFCYGSKIMTGIVYLCYLLHKGYQLQKGYYEKAQLYCGR